MSKDNILYITDPWIHTNPDEEKYIQLTLYFNIAGIYDEPELLKFEYYSQ